MISSAVSSTGEAAARKHAVIIYDGDCIFCKSYTRFVRLRETVGPVELIDARSGHPMVLEYQRQGYDLNEGMLFVYKGQVYHGSDAVHALGGLSSSVSIFNRINRLVFSHRILAKALYPLLKAGRRVTLLLRGKSLIADLN